MWFFWNAFKYLLVSAQSLYFRIVKWFLNRATGLCELQRIVYGELLGSKRISLVEASLMNSRNTEILAMIKSMDDGLNQGYFSSRRQRKHLVNQCTSDVCTKSKNINMKLHRPFVTGFSESIEVIWSFKSLVQSLDTLRETPFDKDSKEHERTLLELWDNLMSPEKLTDRKTRQWQHLGFQGTDPATDFRGAGILALYSFHYFTKNHPEMSRRLLSRSHHPRFCYPFALLSIHITYMTYNMCKQGKAKTHFYNLGEKILKLDESASIENASMWSDALVALFYELCAVLTVEFDKFWFKNQPKDIMEFGRVKSEFENIVLKSFEDHNTCYKMRLVAV